MLMCRIRVGDAVALEGHDRLGDNMMGASSITPAPIRVTRLHSSAAGAWLTVQGRGYTANVLLPSD